VSPADSTREVAHEDFLYHLYRGSELLQDNRVLEAKEALEQALTVQPLDAKGQDLLGVVYFRLGLYPRAIQIYEELQVQFPSDVSIKVNLALGYLKTGQPEPARRVLRDAVQINPDHKKAWGYLGLALQKLGELEQAQVAFERGGRPTMARRVTEFRRSLVPPEPQNSDLRPREGSTPPEIAQSLREVADTAFSELDAGELRFALAEPVPAPTADSTWHTMEIGGTSKSKAPPRSTFTKTLPPPWMGDLDVERGDPLILSHAPLPMSSLPMSAPPVPRVVAVLPAPPIPVPAASPPAEPPASSDRRPTLAPLLGSLGDGSIARHPSGGVVVQTSDDPRRAFAVRLDALRVVAGPVTTQLLNRRTRDAETGDVLGGLGSPLVRVTGQARLVLGARSGQELVLLPVEDQIAFVREDLLAGFELGLHYENGRLAIETGSPEGGAVVQLRGTGTAVLAVSGPLASLPSRTGEPLVVRRDWIVGWFGRLVTRALPPHESPGGHRGLIGFSGEGTVLVCCS
jgi:Tetratricopeptide repeat